MPPILSVAIIAGLLLVGPVDLDPEDGGEITPRIGWYEVACRSWREHLLSRILAYRTTGELDASDAAQFQRAVARADGACVDEQWRGLRLFASLDRALGDWRDAQEENDTMREADR